MQMLWFGDKGLALWIDHRGQYLPDLRWPALHPGSFIYYSPMRADGSLENPIGKPLFPASFFSVAAADEAHIHVSAFQDLDKMYVFPIDMQGNMLADAKPDLGGGEITDGTTFLASNGQLSDLEGHPLIRSTFTTAGSAVTFPGLYVGVRTASSGDVLLQTLTDAGAFDEVKIATAGSLVNTYSAAMTAGNDNKVLIAVGLLNGVDTYLIDKKGTVLRLTQVHRGSSFQGVLAPIWDGTSYLVLWMTGEDGLHWKLEGRRVAPNGDLIDVSATPPTIATTSPLLSRPVRTPRGMIMRWTQQSAPTGAHIYGRTLLSNDDLIASAPLTPAPELVTSAGGQSDISLAPSGALRISAWRESSFASRIMMSIGNRTFEVASSETHFLTNPSIARTLDQILVTWYSHHRDNFVNDVLDHTEVFARRFSLDGTPLDSEAVKVGDTNTGHIAGYAQPIETVADGNGFVVMWPDYARLHLARIGTDGSVSLLPSVVVPETSVEGTRAIVSGGTIRIFFIGLGSHPGLWHLFTTRLTGTATGGLSVITNFDTRPEFAMATDGSNELIVWSDANCVSGMILDGNDSFVVTPTSIACVEHAAQPSAAWSGSEYVVAWSKYTDEGGVQAMRVDQHLHVLDGAPIDVASTAAWEPSLLQNGSGVTIAYVAIGIDAVPRAFTRTLDRLGVLPRVRPSTH
jgi:hypothetical protein